MGARYLPDGTVTFLFTDIEGSTRLVQSLGVEWPEMLAAHSAILTEAIEAHRGVPLKTEGDSFFAVFEDAVDAVLAATRAQRNLAGADWAAPILVRMGIHTGNGVLGGSDYVGIDVHRAARIADSAHGGQIVVSEPTALRVEHLLPDRLKIRDLGKFRLKDLSDPETIFQIDIAGERRDFPPLRTLDAIPNNLPSELTPFFGREDEIATVVALLEKTRLVTLTGAGGTGKTRLALQVAAETSHRYPDGVYFAALSPVTDVEVVPYVILGALGLTAAGNENPRDRLLAELAGKRLLLVVDNFEQILSAAELVGALVRGSTRSSFLVTSRAPLRVVGEQDLAIPPLDVPQSVSVESALASESVQLLVDRARLVRPDFEVTDTNVEDVVHLVERLDGLPLAIELVTSRLRHFPVATIVERLDSRMLSAGPVDLPERQRTIEATIDWSHDLLGPGVKALFARMSVFSGGVRLEDLDKFCSNFEGSIDLIDGIGELVDQSLLTRVRSASGERYRMLHVIRENAAKHLAERGEEEAARRAHLQLYAALVEESSLRILGKERALLLDLIEAEHDNIRSALEWGIEQAEVSLVLSLSASMWRFWQARGYLFEAAERLTGALSLRGAEAVDRANGLEALGGIYWWRGEIERAVEAYEEALAIQRDLGDPAAIANAMYNYGMAVGAIDQSLERGEPMLREALVIYEDLGDDNGIANLVWGLGQMKIALDETDEAGELLEKAVAAYRRAGNEFGLSWALHELGMLYLRKGEVDEAWIAVRGALEEFRRVGDISGVSLAGYAAAGVAKEYGDWRRAYRLYGAVEALVEASGAGLVRLQVNVIEGLDKKVIDTLKGDDLAAYQEGRSMNGEEALAYALAGPTDT